MSKEQHTWDRKTLGLAFIIGLSLNASLAALFSSSVAFSIFPIIALVLAVQVLYSHYMEVPMAEGMGLLAIGSFFVGIFGYSTALRAINPDLGNNFIPLMFCVVIAVWMASKLMSQPKSA